LIFTGSESKRVTWADLTVKVPIKKKSFLEYFSFSTKPQKTKTVLSKVSGYASPGTLLAVMGSRYFLVLKINIFKNSLFFTRYKYFNSTFSRNNNSNYSGTGKTVLLNALTMNAANDFIVEGIYATKINK
uniref:ATPase n=1 Tax=Thelazia callipaeda TaxID=103827 RepID=A0A0N5D8Z5_THECL